MLFRYKTSFRPCRLAALALFALALLGDSAAYAAGAGTLSCTGGSPAGGTSLLGTSCSTTMSLSSLFTGLICNYKLIIDQVLTLLYCGISFAFMPVFAGVVTLATVIFGIKLAMGMTQIREGVGFIVKIGFMVMFATQAAWGIGVGYGFLIGLMEYSMGWVVSAIMPSVTIVPGSGANTVFGIVDSIFFGMLTGPVTTNGVILISFVALLAKALPPLFGLTLYFWFKTLVIFIRAVLTYLLSISAIAFLIALSPLFLSFMMFKPTYTFFDSWLKHLASFVLQVMLIFAALAMWLMLMSYLGDFFVQLANAIRGWQNVLGITNQLVPEDSWGLCPNYTIGTGTFGPTISCPASSEDPIPATQIVKEGPFMYFFIVNIVTLIIAAYAFDTLMGQIPMIAQQLSGPKSITALGGSIGPNGPDFPGLRGLERMSESTAIKMATGKASNKFTDAARKKEKAKEPPDGQKKAQAQNEKAPKRKPPA